MKHRNKGFTLIEMLIVVAIIVILITISIPTFTKLLERSREAADLANVRSAYAEVIVTACLDGDESYEKTVHLKQKLNDWQTADTVTIADITHSNGQEDTANWLGNPVSGGICEVSYSAEVGIILNWKGGGKQPPLTGYEKDPLAPLLHDKLLGGALKSHTGYELDSLAGDTTLIKALKEGKAGTLLEKEPCTWGYYGKTNDPKKKSNNLFWTTVDISNLPKGTQVPVIIVSGDPTTGSDYTYRISYASIADKSNQYGNYKALATGTTYKNAVDNGTPYGSLEEAYKAYEKALKDYEKKASK